MGQVRKLGLAIAAATALSSGMAHALELGELTLKSTLNQPLVAEIELLDVRDLTAAELVPSLASPEEFAKAGVERQAFLDDLTFTPEINANGKSVLRITSSKPLPESFVKFLVQVKFPSGRLLRDYSVLIDPSKFAPPAETAPVDGATPAVTAPAEYTTSKRDTLWEIASTVRQGGSVQQTMLAIQALNPDAFLDGNINRLKTGQVLRMPDAQQVASTPQPQAIAQVAEQNAAWRQGRRLGPRAQQIDATRRAGSQPAPAQVESKDKLSLVSASDKSAGKGAAGDSKALSNKLAVTEENLDTTRRTNAELKGRMTDLQSQLDKMQRLIQLKSDQLAKLEAQNAADASGQSAQAPVDPAISAQLSTPPETVPEQEQAPSATEAAVPAPVPEQAPLQTQEPETADTQNKGENEWLANPVLVGLVGGGGLLLASLLLLLLARRRKAQQEAEKHMRMARALAEESDQRADFDLPPGSFEGLQVPAPNVKLAPAFVAASAAAATAAESPDFTAAARAPAPQPQARPIFVKPAMEPAPVAAQPSVDVLAEAERSIAHGRLNQAADMLEVAVAQEPKRSDLRLKLMEVYAQQGDRDAFVGQERQLIANGKNHADVEALKSRFPAMAMVAAVGAAAIAAQQDAQFVKNLLDEPTPQAAPVQDDLDSAFDLSLDDIEAVSPGERAREERLEAADIPALDDNFDARLKEQAGSAGNADDALMDFDLDIPDDQPKLDVAAQLGAFDDSFDLDDALTEDDLKLPDDFDLSLEGDSSFASELDDVNAELDRLSQSLEQPPLATPTFTAEDAGADDLEFDYLSGTDEAATKLDLAQAYIDMGDTDGARDILDEVLQEGDEKQRQEAKEMLSRLA
ncbi:hypothetical protein D3C84_331930 [compost metagenome]